MKKKIWILLLFCMISGGAFAKVPEVEITRHISLYGEHKYVDGFENFEYVNPRAKKGGKITLPAYGGFDNFNPFILKGIAQGETSELTLDSLGTVPEDDYTTVYPLLAKEFEVPTDESFIGFILDEKAKFSDGSPVLADDVIFSFNALIEKGSPIYKGYFRDIESVDKISDRHVRFMFRKDNKNRELPLIVSGIKIFSKKNFEGKDFSKPYLETYIGSGPYVIDKFEASKYVIFKRRNDYWAKDLPSIKGFYNFDEIRFDYYQDTTITLQALFSGNLDARVEYTAKNWVSAYDNDMVKSGKIIKNAMIHNRPATLQHFSYNLRKDKFKDRNVRKAIGLAFNFDWANENLFYSQYQRIDSYFTNTTMEAIGKPEGLELEILNKYKAVLSPDVFGEAQCFPATKNQYEVRENLRNAVLLLKEAGYDFVDGKMTNLQTNAPLEFEVISNSVNGAVFTRVMLPFIDNLKKIGIKLNFRTLEMNVFKNKIDNFDFDMAILSIPVSRLPGNEQKEFYGSKSANIKGSYNRSGIKNEVVDELIKGLISASSKEEYVSYVEALDRVLRSEYYIIPQWYSASDKVAYWDKFAMPNEGEKIGFNYNTWWIK